MKKIIITITILALISGVLFTGCGVLVRADSENVTGSGNLETREFDFSDFTKVDIGSSFEYEIVQSDTYSVRITADDNLFDDIRVTKKGQTLAINLRPFFHFGVATLEATITMTGGVAKNKGMFTALKEALGVEIRKMEADPQIMGALGAALFARQAVSGNKQA